MSACSTAAVQAVSVVAGAGQLRKDLTPLRFLEDYAVQSRPVVLLEPRSDS